MNFEQQFEEMLTRALTKAIRAALQQSLPASAVVAQQEETQPVGEEPKAKRTRKPKEVEQPPVVEAEFVAEEPAPAPISVVVTAAARPAPAPVQGEGIKADEVERKNVTSCLVTIAKSPELGPAKAYELLNRYGVKEVKDLAKDNYRNLILDAAKMLNITPRQALELDPTKQ